MNDGGVIPPMSITRRDGRTRYVLKWTRFIPHLPTPKQAAFLALSHVEAFYGGEPGGGKSEALLMAALQYVDVPDYRAILFRRTYTDLALPGALMDRAAEWLMPTAAEWNSQRKTWTFPSGATLSFGYLENPADRFRYQSAQFQFIGMDEVTQFPESVYLFMFSRLRRDMDQPVPLRMRSAGNPPMTAEGMWVRDRFVVNRSSERPFIPAGLSDNPHIDREAYMQSLAHLDERTREALFNWFASVEGLVYPEFNHENITAAEDGPDPSLPIELAIDDGYFPDPRVTLFIQAQPDRILVFHELVQYRTLEEETVADILRICEERGWPLPELAVVSHEAPALRDRLRRANIPARNWLARKVADLTGTRSRRVAAVKKLRPLILDSNGRRTLQVHPSCHELIEEMTMKYRYPEGRKARADDHPADANDHAVEALQSWVFMRV